MLDNTAICIFVFSYFGLSLTALAISIRLLFIVKEQLEKPTELKEDMVKAEEEPSEPDDDSLYKNKDGTFSYKAYCENKRRRDTPPPEQILFDDDEA